MNYKAFCHLLESALSDRYPLGELRSMAKMLCEEVSPGTLYGRIADVGFLFSEAEQERLRQMCRELVEGRPIQYIIGHTHFRGLLLRVAEGVLIPRPETEELVEWILHEKAQGVQGVLDLCTGSGAIALALAAGLGQGSRVEGWDVSPDALALAVENGKDTGLTDVVFREQDVLTYQPQKGELEAWDIVVSNPPYVMRREMVSMARHVLDYEPHLALFVEDEDPLLFYREIAQLACRLLRRGGLLYFEINALLADETAALLRSMGYGEVELREDVFGKKRMLKGVRL